MDQSPILLMFTENDTHYIPYFKPFLKNRKAFLITGNPTTFAEIVHYAESKGIKYIISTNSHVLNKVVESGKSNSINNWNGSLYERAGITFLFIQSLDQFFTVPYGKFLAERFVSKIIEPARWPRTPEFCWELANPTTIDKWYERFTKATLIAVDIETKNYIDPNDNTYVLIRCICYSGLWINEVGAESIYTIVLPISEAPEDQQSYWLTWMRKFDSLRIPKVYQNGLYDTSHQLTYGSPVSHYLWDTQSLFHSWYSELPKDLGFITAFCCHNVFYWKDMADGSNDLRLLYEYNARDGWGTLVSLLGMLKELPVYAIKNHLIKFPLWPICSYMNLEGLKVNESTRQALIAEYIDSFKTTRTRLEHWFGQGFNPNSPQQVIKLIQFYGSYDIASSDTKSLAKFSLRHPLNARFAGEIKRARETAKAISTYLKPKDFSVAVKSTKKQTPLLKNERIFYALNPDGTDTGRLACREGVYWTGSQIQNQPEKVKGMYEADPGFELFEMDNTCSESFCTGYLSGDTNLINTLLSGKDFHGVNAERFFGVPYDEIIAYKDGLKKVINKKIRDLAKKTNHGASYDMQWFTLLETMGEQLVDEAKVLLKLPKIWTRRRTCEYLLECFDKAYPTVQHAWYNAITEIAASTHMLVSPLGWTRYCFSNPQKSKREKDGYIAHCPQNLSVGIINEGLKRIFWEIQVPNYKHFRLKAQIHDSVFGQYRIGFQHLVFNARDILTMRLPIKDMVRRKERVMTIPVTIKVGPNWGNMHEIIN